MMKLASPGRLAGKTVLITGVGPGIGRACAWLYAREGARVLAVGRRPAMAKELKARADKEGWTLDTLVADVTKSSDLKKITEYIRRNGGRLDAYHHNAGYWEAAPLISMTSKAWDAMFEVNVKSAFLAAQALAPLMKAQKGGALLFTGAIFGPITTPRDMGHYNASKAALASLVKSLAREWCEWGIRVNGVLPGTISHELASKDGSLAVPRELDRTGRPEDVAHAALYLLSDEASWMTGVLLPVDGGASLGIHPGKKA